MHISSAEKADNQASLRYKITWKFWSKLRGCTENPVIGPAQQGEFFI